MHANEIPDQAAPPKDFLALPEKPLHFLNQKITEIISNPYRPQPGYHELVSYYVSTNQFSDILNLFDYPTFKPHNLSIMEYAVQYIALQLGKPAALAFLEHSALHPWYQDHDHRRRQLNQLKANLEMSDNDLSHANWAEYSLEELTEKLRTTVLSDLPTRTEYVEYYGDMLVKNGFFAQAAQGYEILPPELDDYFTVGLIKGLAETGELTAAIELNTTIDLPELRYQSLLALAKACAIHQPEQAHHFLTEALSIHQSTYFTHKRIDLLCQAALEAGQIDLAWQALSEVSSEEDVVVIYLKALPPNLRQQRQFTPPAADTLPAVFDENSLNRYSLYVEKATKNYYQENEPDQTEWLSLKQNLLTHLPLAAPQEKEAIIDFLLLEYAPKNAIRQLKKILAIFNGQLSYQTPTDLQTTAEYFLNHKASGFFFLNPHLDNELVQRIGYFAESGVITSLSELLSLQISDLHILNKLLFASQENSPLTDPTISFLRDILNQSEIKRKLTLEALVELQIDVRDESKLDSLLAFIHTVEPRNMKAFALDVYLRKSATERASMLDSMDHFQEFQLTRQTGKGMRSNWYDNPAQLPPANDWQTLLPYFLYAYEQGEWSPRILSLVHQEYWTELSNHLLNTATLRSEIDNKIVLWVLLSTRSGEDSFYGVDKFFQILSLIEPHHQPSLESFEDYRQIFDNSQDLLKLFKEDDRSGTLQRLISQEKILTQLNYFLYLKADTVTSIIRQLDQAQDQHKTVMVRNFISRIIKEKTSFTNSVFETVDRLKVDLTDQGEQTAIWEMLNDFHGISPETYLKYRTANANDRHDLKNRIFSLREKFFTNYNLNLAELDLEQQLLAEYILILYRPVNMTVNQISLIINQLKHRDMTKDLEKQGVKLGGDLWDPTTECFVTTIEEKKYQYAWKEGQSLSPYLVDLIGKLYNQGRSGASENAQLQIRDSIVKLVKSGPAIQPTDLVAARDNDPGVTLLQGLFKILPLGLLDTFHELYHQLQRQEPNQSQEALVQLRILFGEEQKNAHNPTEGTAHYWQEMLEKWLTTHARPLIKGDILRAVGTDSTPEAAQILSELIAKNVLSKVLSSLKKEAKKLERTNLSDASIQKPLHFYVSKNMASFFAKAAAGLCTNMDVITYNNEAVFHINMVDPEEGTIVGNIQAYVVEHKGKKVLMLRGINPTVSYSSESRARSIVETSLKIGQEIVAQSGFDALYFSEPLGGALADSNRLEIAKLLRGQYLTPFNREPLERPLPISDHSSIDYMHLIWKNPSAS